MAETGIFITCPKCSSDDLEMNEYMNEGAMSVEIVCNGCGYRWTDKVAIG